MAVNVNGNMADRSTARKHKFSLAFSLIFGVIVWAMNLGVWRYWRVFGLYTYSGIWGNDEGQVGVLGPLQINVINRGQTLSLRLSIAQVG